MLNHVLNQDPVANNGSTEDKITINLRFSRKPEHCTSKHPSLDSGLQNMQVICNIRVS